MNDHQKTKAELIKELESLRKSLTEETPSERQQIEIAHSESESKYSALFESVSDAIFFYDPDTFEIQSANEACSIMYGYDRDELIGMSCLNFSAEVDKSKDVATKILEVGRAYAGARYHKKKDGSDLYVNLTGLKLAGNGRDLYFAICRDVTERKQAEEDFLKKETLLKITGRTAKVGGWEFDAETMKQTWTDQVYLIHEVDFSFDPNVSNGMNFYAPLSRPVIEKALQRAIEFGEPFDLELEFITNKGNHLWVRSIGEAQQVNGVTKKMFGSIQDITERKLAEKALHISGEKYKALFNSVSDAIFTFDPVTMEIIEANEATSKLYGYDMDELLGMSCLKLSAEASKSKAVASSVIEQGLVIVPERHHLKKDGSDLYVELDVYQVKTDVEEYVFTVCRDITKRKQAEQERIDLEAQLHQSQKLEAIGTMVGGISHEFNNVLQSMFLYASLVQADLPEDDVLRSNFQRILDGGNRARDLIKQVLTFSRKTEVEMKPRYLHELVQELLLLERASLPSNIDIQQGIDLNCGLVLCDKTQIHQILINLCNNAQHAMEAKGGTLTVSLKQVQASMNNGNTETAALELTVSDTGHGIDASDLERIFDPFFTTKQFGKGTGLGLSVIHGIVEMMDGQISVTSELGKGTTFRILFPVTEAVQEEDVIKSSAAADVMSRSILLVDDEESIREVTQTILRSKGFAIESVPDGQKAFDLFKANPNKYNLIVTDLSMPIMSGIELCQAIRASGSDIPIMLSTGQLDIEDQQEYANIGITKSIQKPWTADELIARIQEIDIKPVDTSGSV